MNINNLINNYQKENNEKTRNDLLLQMKVASYMLEKGNLLEIFEIFEDEN